MASGKMRGAEGHTSPLAIKVIDRWVSWPFFRAATLTDGEMGVVVAIGRMREAEWRMELPANECTGFVGCPPCF